MNIGKTIKKLRIKNEMTQEELANMCGVSMQAVSRWETSVTYPDITLLPVIASLFHITTDELLGVDLLKQDEYIKQVINAAKEYAKVGNTEERIDVIRNGLKECPNNYVLLDELINALSAYYYANYDEHNPKNDTLKEIIKLSEKVLKECNDNEIRNHVSQNLCYAYNNNGDNDQAIKIANSMASLFQSKDVLLSDILPIEEQAIQAQKNIKLALSLIQIEALYKLPNEDVHYNIKLFNRLIEIGKTFFENQEYGFYNNWLMKDYLELAENYAKVEDKENAMHAIENAIKHAQDYQKRTNKKKYTNILFDHLYDDPNDISKNMKITEKDEIMRKINKSIFEFIKNEVRWQNIIEMINKIK